MILAASMLPSALPAPIIVCSSSIKSIMRSSVRSSSKICFIRSSNSPRYLAPATSMPSSKEKIIFFCKNSGTSPWTILVARDSATAVLPTPASPMITGLFLVRRHRIWISRSTSTSRPITGSMRPCCASSFKLRPYPASTLSTSSFFSKGGCWMRRPGTALRRSSKPRIMSLTRLPLIPNLVSTR